MQILSSSIKNYMFVKNLGMRMPSFKKLISFTFGSSLFQQWYIWKIIQQRGCSFVIGRSVSCLMLMKR